MTAPKINMHGKIYDLYDEVDRPQKEAKAELVKIHATGKRAFLNPRKRKNFETTYFIYTANPTPRKAPTSKPKEGKKPKEVEKSKTSNGKKASNGKKSGNGKKAPAKKK